MFRPLSLLWSWPSVFIGLALAAAAHAAADNRGRTQPGLIIETGGRNGACDVLKFTPDGRNLMAVGDDKVVRVWPLKGDQLDADNARVLRWTIWREQRGSIYALAYDAKHNRVAVGGKGDTNGRVSVLDVATGQVLFTIPAKLGDPYSNGAVLWSMAFSPSGNLVAFGADDGSVWVWDLTSDGQRDVRYLGNRIQGGGNAVNPVRWVGFDGEDRLLSADSAGRVLAWNTHKSNQPRDEVFQFRLVNNLFRVAASPDGKWLAAAGDSLSPEDKGGDNIVEVRSLDGREGKTITLPMRNHPRCLAFDATGGRLAVGVQLVPPEATFQKFAPGPVYLCDLTQKEPRPGPVLTTSYYADALAFDPKDPSRLAVAGGADHEVTLWRLGRGPAERLSQIAGPGKCLWSVGLDQKNPLLLGIRATHAPDPESPNRRGAGPWIVFDLNARKWTDAAAFKPVEPIETAGGWTVRPDPHDAYVWYVAAANGRQWPLPLTLADNIPRCYTFLDPAAEGGNVRLAVGHYWGASVFDLDPKNGPRRIRLFTGHQGEVMALAPSPDQTQLVSASRDQTVAAWSLSDWPAQAELGAKFRLADDKLMVDRVDTGSPAWEAGLAAGDEVIELICDINKFLFEKDHAVTREDVAEFKVVGPAQEALARLRQPLPGKELIIEIARNGKRVGTKLTTVRQRPLWRFLPIFERPDEPPEWVLWLWHDYYYDTSTRGDYYIGWQVNGPDGTTPTFYRAEQFRKRYHDPSKVMRVIRLGADDPDLAHESLLTFEPPKVTLDAPAALAGPVVPVGLTVEPRGPTDEQKASRVVIWVNNYAAWTWAPSDGPLPKHVDLPRGAFRAGHNQVMAQAYNSDLDARKRGRERSDSEIKEVNNTAPAASTGTLYVVAAGVHDYSQVKRGGAPFAVQNLLFPDRDAQAIANACAERKDGRLFRDVQAVTLTDAKATRAAIRAELHKVAERAGPDDAFLLFLSGHGFALEVKDNTFRPGTFAFCTPDFDVLRPEETGLTGDDLAEDLGAIRCRKLVLLDACHSGGAAPGSTDGVRDLTPDNVGPLILAACGLAQEAQEAPALRHGVFTRAVLDALTDRFAEADRDGNGILDADELADEVIRQVPKLCDKTGVKAHTPARQYMAEDRNSSWMDKK